MPIIGIEKAYYAKQITDTSQTLTYEIPVYLQGVKELGLKPKQNNSVLYAENRLQDQVNKFDSADISLALADLTSVQRAALLGQTIAASGGVFAKDTDEAPYVALLYKANLKGGGYRYGVLYKGMFGLPDDSMKGQEDKIEFQTPTVEAKFQPTLNNGMWEYHVDTTDPNCPEDIDSTWFDSVTVPTADTTAPTVSTSPNDGDISVAASENIVFTFSKAIDPNTMTDSNIFLMQADGTPVAASLSIGTDNTVVTLNPNSDLSTGDYVAVCTKNVKSATGVALTTNVVVNFTVA